MTMRSTSPLLAALAPRAPRAPLVAFRRGRGYALIVAAALTIAPATLFAQDAGIDEAAPVTQSADPPGRVARLNYMAGTVTTEPAGATDWSYASINRPLTTGDQLWNDANARSELHIGSTAVRLGASTNLDILSLDDTNAQLKVGQGTLSTHVRELTPGSSYEIDTPNVALGVTKPGDYRVDVAPDGSTTTVTVRRGAMTAYGENGQMPLWPGDQITFTGTSLQEVASRNSPAPDAFDQWAAARDNAEDRSLSARYVSREIPGYEDLDANGTWREDPQYGAVWAPSAVPAGWAPYHYGHWAWIAPWGWTWVDDAPWGFAPYHYGRWAYLGSSWCWIPGQLAAAPPVYAPALVAFVGDAGDGPDWSVSLMVGGAAAAGLAWFPLGPGEVWHPHDGGWSPRYFERVNQTVIVNRNVNIANIHNTYINYRAPGAITAMPRTAFVQGRPVARFAQRVDPRQWHNVRLSAGAPGVAPVRESYAPGLRAAAYHPPSAVAGRQVLATRAPVAPPGYRDSLAPRFAQSGGHVAGAGRPSTAQRQPNGPEPNPREPGHRGTYAQGMRNVRVVGRESPVVMQAHGPARTEAPQAAATGGAPRPPGAPPAGNPAGPRFEHHAPQAPIATHSATNGVPRPPVENAAPGNTAGMVHGGPAWTQPHLPMDHRHVATAPAPQPPAEARGQAAQGQSHVGASMPPTRHPEPRAEPRPRVQPGVAAQSRPQPPAHVEAPPPARFEPRSQPRVEMHPQPRMETSQPPRMEMHPPPTTQPSHVELRAPAAPQHIEMRAPPPPRMEMHPPPTAQPSHVEMRAPAAPQHIEMRAPPPPRAEPPQQPQPPHAQPHDQPHPQSQGHEGRHQG